MPPASPRGRRAPQRRADPTRHSPERRRSRTRPVEEAAREERLDLVLRSLQRGPDPFAEALVRQRRARVPEHDRPGGHVLVKKKGEKRRVGFLLGEIPRAPEHRDGEHVALIRPVRLVALGRHGGFGRVKRPRRRCGRAGTRTRQGNNYNFTTQSMRSLLTKSVNSSQEDYSSVKDAPAWGLLTSNGAASASRMRPASPSPATSSAARSAASGSFGFRF